MKKIRYLAWIFVGALVISRLAAQDVRVTDPAWADPDEPMGDQLPVFKRRPKPEYPEELEKIASIQYAIFHEYIEKGGGVAMYSAEYSNPYLEDAIIRGEPGKFLPAQKDKNPTAAAIWYGVIFNPKSASEKNAEASPRLLQVYPATIDLKLFSEKIDLPFVSWVTVGLSTTGEIKRFVFENGAQEPLRPAIEASFKNWKFAAARKGGVPVEAEVKVPVVLTAATKWSRNGVPPSVVHREEFRYPQGMARSGLVGEVLLEFVVKVDGSVYYPVVVKSNNPGFNESAVEAIKEWKFKPARMNGVPVNARMQLPVVFSIDDNVRTHEYSTVEVDRKKQKDLPDELRFDVPPRNENVANPIYPFALLEDSPRGKAKIAFLVLADGSIGLTRVMEASRPEFGYAAAASVETYHFKPALKDGKPTQALLSTEVTFRSSLLDPDSNLISTERKHPDRILPAVKLDKTLHAVYRRIPKFPRSLDKVDSGEAVVEFLIAEDGSTHLGRIVSASDPVFGYAAVQAVSEWRFDPPVSGGKPVVTRARVPFVFRRPAPDAKEGDAEDADEKKPGQS